MRTIQYQRNMHKNAIRQILTETNIMRCVLVSVGIPGRRRFASSSVLCRLPISDNSATRLK